MHFVDLFLLCVDSLEGAGEGEHCVLGDVTEGYTGGRADAEESFSEDTFHSQELRASDDDGQMEEEAAAAAWCSSLDGAGPPGQMEVATAAAQIGIGGGGSALPEPKPSAAPIPTRCLAMHAAAMPSQLRCRAMHADARGARQASRSEPLGASQTRDRQISLRLHASTGRKGGHWMHFASGQHRILFHLSKCTVPTNAFIS